MWGAGAAAGSWQAGWVLQQSPERLRGSLGLSRPVYPAPNWSLHLRFVTVPLAPTPPTKLVFLPEIPPCSRACNSHRVGVISAKKRRPVPPLLPEAAQPAALPAPALPGSRVRGPSRLRHPRVPANPEFPSASIEATQASCHGDVLSAGTMLQ